MSSSESTDRILDLLYGEKSPEEVEALRREIEQSPDDEADLASFEETLAAFRQAVPKEEVPSSVHASIMAQAKKQAAENVAAASTGRPSRPVAPGASVWSRLSIGPIAQIATVATLLLVGAFFIRQMGEEMSPKFQDAARETVYNEVRFDNLDFGAAASPAPAQEELAMAPEMEAPEMEAAEEQAPTGALGSLDGQEVAAAETARSRVVSRPRPAPAPSASSGRAAPSREESYGVPRQAPLRRAASQNIEQTLDFDSIGRGGGSARAESPTMADEATKSAPAPIPAPAPAPAPAKKSESIAFAPGDDTGDDTVELAQDRATSDAVFADKEASPNALAQAESALRTSNYREAVAQADAALASPSTSSNERARALDIKGQALLAMGRDGEADQVFATLESQYPSYQSDRISTTREGIAARRRATRRQVDEAADAPMEAAEPAASPPAQMEMAPSSPTSY